MAVLLPVFVCDQFRIGGGSMEPSLIRGDHIFVNKLLFGARIYKKYDFTDPQLESFRVPGIREIRQNDVVVFNSPRGWGREKIEFKINYVYVKRCIGCPGDTVSISGGYYENSHCQGLPGNKEKQDILAGSTQEDLERLNVYLPAMPFSASFGWTVVDFGPLYIPEKGGKIKLDSLSVRLYERAIEYETGELPQVRDGLVYMGDVPISEYVFKDNWYFFGGDNVLNSKDSRYIGIVPEEYIVGIATRVLYSWNPDFKKFNWKRFLKKL